MNYGGQNEAGTIERIVLKHARDAFVSQEFIATQWQELGYTAAVNYESAMREYDAFVSLLQENVREVNFIPRDDRVGIDSIYVRDASLITDKGAILCNMGKETRRAEPQAVREFYQELGIPILGAIAGDGYVEGGDVVWIGGRTLVVGRGYRTNDEGIRQLRELTADLVDEFIVVPLPHWHGPSDVFHLMSFISPIDHDLALVYSPLLPVPFREWLLSKGIELVDVPDSEFETMGCNVLAVAPRRCVMLKGNPLTRDLLGAAGAEVFEYEGNEISRKGEGGPTCLTRPICRSL
jgi:N-dimethylarginine dimethylaminohydrolase